MGLITSRPKIKTTVDSLPLAYQLFTEGNYVPLIVDVERSTITDDLTNTVVTFSASGGGGEYYISKSSEFPSQIALMSITPDRIRALVKLVKEDTLFFLDGVTSFRYSVGLKTEFGLMELESGYFNVNPSLTLGKESQSQIPDEAPLIELTAPKTGEKLFVNKSVRLMAKASDVGGAVEKVDFFANDIKIGTNTSYSVKGVWDLKYVPTQAGAVTFYAVATDTSKNTSKSNAVAVTVEPEPVIPTANFGFTPLTGSAPLAVTFINSSVNAATYSWNFGDNTALSTAIAPTHVFQTSGNYIVTLTATNEYGSSAISKNISVTTAVNQPPTVSITNPGNNTSIVAGQQIALTASATDVGGSIASVQFKVNNINQGAALTSTPYTSSFTPASAGTYSITAVATDNQGLTTTSNPVSLTVVAQASNQPPTISITSPTNNAAITVGQVVTLQATASDSDGSVASVQFKVNGVNQGGAITTAPFSTSWTPSASGNFTITAVATDDDGLSTTSTAVTAVVSPPANQLPTITVTAPTTGTTNQAITLSATASDPDGSIASVQFRVNGTNEGAADTTSPYSISWTPTVSGNYSITAIATDNSGGTTTSAAVSVTVTAPSIPTPTISVTAPKAGLINEAQTLGATATVTGDTVSGVQFTVNDANQGTSDTVAPYSTTWTPTVKGVYSVRAMATAALGGTATATAVTVPIYDTKLDPNINGGSGAGCSLGAEPGNYILFDDNQAGGGLAATMAINVGGTQVGALNYTDTAYSNKPFAFFYQGQFLTGNIQTTVNF